MGTGIAPSEDGEEKQGAPTHEFPLISIKKFTILTSLVVWLIQLGYKTIKREFNLLLFFLKKSSNTPFPLRSKWDGGGGEREKDASKSAVGSVARPIPPLFPPPPRFPIFPPVEKSTRRSINHGGRKKRKRREISGKWKEGI